MSVDKRLYGSGFFDLSRTIATQDKMVQDFAVPPFSILDAKKGYWTSRKKTWLNVLNIKDDLGRREDDVDIDTTASYRQGLDGFGSKARKELDKKTGRVKKRRVVKDTGHTGISVFDPVLCEVAYRWFGLANGTILDPFAGGPTRGMVAEFLGYKYTGIEVRQGQVDANYIQANGSGLEPTWLCGDSSKMDDLLPRTAKYDFIFTCPPYFDLEVYSHDGKDGSTHDTYDEFIDWLIYILDTACKRLRKNRFAVFVVGDIRDKVNGNYRGFPSDLVTRLTREAGLIYWNELILCTSIGSLPIRAGKSFKASRKIAKAHQNILVFYKGDTAKIHETFPNFI